MNICRYEQETIINYNAAEQTATVYTRDKTYEMPKTFVSYRFPLKFQGICGNIYYVELCVRITQIRIG